jgi:hypothetical protein
MIYLVRLASRENKHSCKSIPSVPEGLMYTASIEECQRRVLEYIDTYNLDVDTWKGGEVYDGLGNLIGHISYNGNICIQNE